MGEAEWYSVGGGPLPTCYVLLTTPSSLYDK